MFCAEADYNIHFHIYAAYVPQDIDIGVRPNQFLNNGPHKRAWNNQNAALPPSPTFSFPSCFTLKRQHSVFI